MANLAFPIERVIEELSKLPSVGRKTAQRLAFHLLRAPVEDALALSTTIRELRERIRDCERCFNLAEDPLCPICADPGRDAGLLCIVEGPTNILAFERTSAFRGLYHVLGGALSPLRDIGPEQLHIQPLIDRLESESIREVVLATNPNVEGEATAVYLARLLASREIVVSRLAQGLPAGSELEYTDDLTLRRAFEGRNRF
ncbi:MAG: recombination mediator RecR [Acidobacteriota bacterium]|nr:recombination mediator RecR [Acidobacteriota bacterium]MDH3784877.1 recombination mediator RecR [Acidobacteriota bacterium]